MLNLKNLFTKKEQPKQAIKIDLSIRDKATCNHHFFDNDTCNINAALDFFNYTNMNAIDMNFIAIDRVIAKGVR